MKKLVILTLLINLISCSELDTQTQQTGNIYGVVTIDSSGEPMRATAIQLHYHIGKYMNLEDNVGALLLSTVTYDDGHYEFNDLTPGDYIVSLSASGYSSKLLHVVVESGRTAHADMQLTKLDTRMTVRTLTPTPISYNSVQLNGSYTYTSSSYSPDEVGFCYSQSQTQILSDHKLTATKATSFNAEAKNLTPGTWYVQAYAKNDIGTAYGEIVEFYISNQPVVKTLDVTNLTGTTATLNGYIEYEGVPAYTKRGFVYSSSFPSPTIDDPASETINVVVSGRAKEFGANISNLKEGTKYYARAYVTNNESTYYGDAISFKHDKVHTVSSINLMVQQNDISAGAEWSDAQDLCKASRVNGFSDWRVPTSGECKALNESRSTLGIKNNTYYWTSERDSYSSNYRYAYYFSDTNPKTESYHYAESFRVRCVRSID
ncbi:MAG: DUF1566 domain-containing protein [Alistipes sp.]|nr:DUF1566 domain-containing protein [Alistipes sp.]